MVKGENETMGRGSLRAEWKAALEETIGNGCVPQAPKLEPGAAGGTVGKPDKHTESISVQNEE